MSIRKSAALILVNSKDGKILFGRRSSAASFMANALVFPGGVVDQEDAAFPVYLSSYAGQKKPLDFARKVAAVRELFEECGLLPVIKDSTERCILSASSNRYLFDWQLKLQRRDSLFQKLIAENERHFRVDLSGFHLSSWLTPFDYPKRYENSFYVMKTDYSPTSCPHKSELQEADWLFPENVVKHAEHGSEILPPPQAYETMRIIRARRENKHFEEVADLKLICPQLLNNGEKLIAVLHGDQHYIEDVQSTGIPMRDVGETGLIVDKRKPINRITYRKRPMYSYVKVYISL